jgi:hypothetical protein
MKLHEDVCAFGRICEHLLYSVHSTIRPMTQEESLFMKYYCKELLDMSDADRKPAPPSPSLPSSATSD